ncbi:16S rRNA (cytidine(1402)-2'-O)-methyltransferase [Terrilactibacillus sp. BCM23-1]|uniref:Ribosomal RNA small subunit methyltransferase I n=1 Tax=Terrilactibacillus tamarindi TaxID=2599694 RepID=A0A6N8CTB2_9BACI|nr:16S rRNA (cytidine(1402)-2'-O)-methyltransferase [Terrilactibacillus tamarindi]MTT32970.1 16S rRNA (cytidine(1402)-2'-O)-methyltransferase [Terrilactibacillus tamarindi]
MWTQESYKKNQEKGILYLVPTPIGNLEDMTMRAIRVLKEADILAAEDTRQTMKLCNHFDIHTQLVSYHEHNKQTSGEKLIQALQEGKSVAIVTDAGTPAISDPGYDLVVRCIENKINIVPLPGANAAITALIASGLDTEHFLFYGFLPRQKKQKQEALESLSHLPFTLIFYESPYRVKETLESIHQILGNRRVTLSRELTKTYETMVRGTLQEIIQAFPELTIKGEYCLIVEGTLDEQPSQTWWDDLNLEEHLTHYVKVKQMSSKEAIKVVAKERGIPKREVYQYYIETFK